MLQQLILNPSGYTDCVAGDKNKLVTDDVAIIGTLIDYNNTTYTWIINTPNTIVTDSVMTIFDGTGAGVAFSDSTVLTNYCLKNIVKDRMLIGATDTSFDDALDSAIEEASRLVDIFLKPYIDVPITIVDEQVEAITADFSASIFKRRYTPQEAKLRGTLQPDMINDIDGTGWFALGLRKIEQYIKSYYVLAETVGSTVHNPDIYMALFKQGLITGKEARNFINVSSAVATSLIETITKTLGITETQILTETLTKTLDESDIIKKGITISEELTKTLSETDTIIKTLTETDIINKTLTDVISKGETLTKEQTDDIVRSLVNIITEDKTLTKTQEDTITTTLHDIIIRGETLTKTQSDIINNTIADIITRGETLTKTQTDTITRTLYDVITKGETLTKTETDTITKTLTDIQGVTKTLDQKDIVDTKTTKTLDAEEIHNIMYPTKKQNKFSFISSDKNGGYKEDS